jgi:protein phosphatase
MTADQRNAELRRLARDERTDGNPWESDDSEIHVHDAPPRRVTPRVLAFLLVLVLVLGGAAAAIGFYARGAYFVGLDEGTVAIFKGRPGGLLWFAPTVEERTDLAAAAVPQARVDDVTNGHAVTSLEEARSYVRNLEATAANITAPTSTTSPPSTTTPSSAPPDTTATSTP